MQDPRNLRVFMEAEELALLVYRLARSLPSYEQFGLAQQMRRAVVSIGSNIAEGCGRGGEGELSRFLLIALGSAMELEFQLRLARRSGFMSDVDHRSAELCTRTVQRMLTRLIQRVRPARNVSQSRPKTDNR
ncbi:MAG: four helix bundle protein [Gemmatimonadaceae bacterium]